MKYTLNDIFIVPAVVSDIDSRSQCNPLYENGLLPLFTAPMSSVVGIDNYGTFLENKIKSIIPRNEDLASRLNLCKKTWCAFSLSEFIENFVNARFYDMDTVLYYNGHMFVLIDIANGHMKKMHDAIRKAKQIYGDKIVIMAGNIANPETYVELSEAGADYVRVGIGTGSVCITSSNTGIHYPIASLITECYEKSLGLYKPALIVADGGCRGYSDIIKCLALGADYVMCGSIFSKMLESHGPVYLKCDNEYTELKKEHVTFSNGKPNVLCNEVNPPASIVKKYYGMSTRKAQREINGEDSKTSEGIEKEITVDYSISQWVENFIDYLKSSMSYTNSKTLENFIGKVNTIIVSNNSSGSINK